MESVGGMVTDGLSSIFRWLHVFAGIIWIGQLYFFNFVNGPMAATLDGDTKKKVVPELMPRALFWFRWGAAWTWITGVLLLTLVFYHGGLVQAWDVPTIVMVVFVFVAPFLYDRIVKSPLTKNPRVWGISAIVLVGVVLALMNYWAAFDYRTMSIHLGAMFGTIMAFNVWFRIWPAQQKIITAVKEGKAPDAALVAMAGGRSRHNTYMSVPLVWTMINQHTTYFSGGNLGMTDQCAWVGILAITALGWHIVWHCYKKAGKVKGF